MTAWRPTAVRGLAGWGLAGLAILSGLSACMRSPLPDIAPPPPNIAATASAGPTATASPDLRLDALMLHLGPPPNGIEALPSGPPERWNAAPSPAEAGPPAPGPSGLALRLLDWVVPPVTPDPAPKSAAVSTPGPPASIPAPAPCPSRLRMPPCLAPLSPHPAPSLPSRMPNPPPEPDAVHTLPSAPAAPDAGLAQE